MYRQRYDNKHDNTLEKQMFKLCCFKRTENKHDSYIYSRR